MIEGSVEGRSGVGGSECGQNGLITLIEKQKGF